MQTKFNQNKLNGNKISGHSGALLFSFPFSFKLFYLSNQTHITLFVENKKFGWIGTVLFLNTCKFSIPNVAFLPMKFKGPESTLPGVRREEAVTKHSYEKYTKLQGRVRNSKNLLPHKAIRTLAMIVNIRFFFSGN